ncbi:MAG: hypothetical protein A2158_02595 [Chloroflexi bacterium RBG_13_46_14]|nr:MAG: hypothetical protein A2158_02595 [Chloroflexi bacterium RBG_13_46_14]
MANFNFRKVFGDIRKWRKSVNLLAFVLLVRSAVLVAGMVSYANSKGEAIDTEEGPPQRSGEGTDPSWAFTYNSIENMCAHSDIIVVGTADSIIEIEEDHAMYMTYWDFKIESVLKGDDMEEIMVGLTVEPYGEYESRILITTAYNVDPGTYLISVEYDFEGVGSCSRAVTLHVNDPADFPEVTNEDLIEQGLPPLGGSEEE